MVPTQPTPRSLALLVSLTVAACGGTPDEAPASQREPEEPESVASALSTVPAGATPYRGVNLSGADFGSALPGREWFDYVWPTAQEVDYYRAKGMNTFRIGFQWERLQNKPSGAFVAAYFAKLDALVRYVTVTKGGYAVLNPQNFARYYGSTVGSAAVPNAVFADLWRRLAATYKANPRVLFGLVNEPNTMPTEQWVGAANAAIAAIRTAGAGNVVLAPGNGWTGAHSWTSNWYGTSNAVAMLGIKDPASNVLFEVHQYLDVDSSGSLGTCVSSTVGSQRMKSFVAWLRTNKKRAFLGEFAGGRDATCLAAVKDMLTYVMAQPDVLVGWTWWGGGPWWGDTYPFTLEPLKGVARPQLAVLTPFLATLPP
jgi:endoglucanase